MPIEIRQMIIKAKIDSKAAAAPAPQAAKQDCDCVSTLSADDFARFLKDREER